MKEHRSAILCLVTTTNYSCLTTETFYYGWTAVTGKNIFKSGIFIYTFLFTEFSSVHSGTNNISSLVLSLFPMKENPWSKSFPSVLVLIILSRYSGFPLSTKRTSQGWCHFHHSDQMLIKQTSHTKSLWVTSFKNDQLTGLHQQK